ncbi:MAG: STAS/SEC14 domain-containing protein [Chitinophagaceae bacterium]
MLTLINDLPSHVVGLKATGDIGKEDLENVLIPALEELLKRTGKINYLLLLETGLSNFTLAAWFKDVQLGLKNFKKWNRIAIVSDQNGVNTFSDVFGYIIPGDSKGFRISELEEAKLWVAS